MRRVLRRVGIVGVVASLAIAMVGCSAIPMSGGVIPGEVIDPEDAPVGFLPSGPQTDATPKQVIEGFIRAGTSPSDDFLIARQFLSSAEQSRWQPNALTQVRSGIGSITETAPGIYTYTMFSKAFVDAEGHYSEENTTQTLEFHLRQNSADQWRITEAPDGIVLSLDSFGTIFEDHALYFFDPTYRYLVPDVRWFAKTNLLPSRVVTTLLAGQSPYLRQGVTNSEFPSGTTLTSRVVVDSGVATVDLSEEVAAASVKERQRMWQQLVPSIGGVSNVVLTVNGVPIDVPPTPVSPIINPTVVSQLLVRIDDKFGFLQSDGTIANVPGQSNEIIALDANAVNLAFDASISAVRASGGVYLVLKDNPEAVLLDARPRLAAPSVDASYFVWSVPSNSPRSILAFDKKGQSYPINASVLPKGQVVSFSLSRDGARLLLLMNTTVGPRLLVAGVRRNDGVPTALADPVYLPFDQSTTPRDAEWVDDRTVATLATEAGSEYAAVTTYVIGGQRTSAGRVLDGEGLAVVGGNSGRDGLRVKDSSGAVFLLRGNTWADTNTVVSFIGTQQ
jgi:hypothetical protein